MKFASLCRLVLGVLLLLCVAPPVALAQHAPPDHADTLPVLRQHWETIADLEARGILSKALADSQRTFYLQKASHIVGRTLSKEDFLTWNQRTAILTLSDWIRILGAIILVIAVAYLAITYIGPLLRYIPATVWEGIFYCLAAVGMFATGNMWVVFPSCLLLLATLITTFTLHGLKNGEESRDLERAFSTISLTCMTAWGATALYHRSTELGYLTILACESLLGFCVFTGPLCVAIGFEEENKTVSGTFASLILLIGGAILQSGVLPFATQLFHPLIGPCLFIGTFVYFTGLIILSSKWVAEKNYVSMQVLTILSGAAAIWLGPALGLPFLQAVGGTFFVFWLLEKYIELPWENNGFYWALLGFGILLYGISWGIRLHPEYFIFHMPAQMSQNKGR